jgi:3-oxoacyl-[acyl-carrier protein] reductase
MTKKENANKVAVVTGSSRGIGRAIATKLAKRGISVVINNDKDPQEGLDVMNEIKNIGQDGIYIQADVSDLTQVEKMIEKVVNEFGRIDILINNAGITRDGFLENMDRDDWNSVLSVNLTGTFNCTKSVTKYMKKQGGGKIVNISSISAETGNIGQSNYSAAKGGIISFTKTVAKEYAKYGITVNAVAPGFIKTKMLETVPEKVMQKIIGQIPLGRLGEPDDVAAVVCFLISDDATYITGQLINVNGGIYM